MQSEIIAIVVVTILFQLLVQLLNASWFAYRVWRGRKMPFMPLIELNPTLPVKSISCDHPNWRMNWHIERWPQDKNRYTVAYNMVCAHCSAPVRFHGALGANPDAPWVHDDTRTQVNIQAYISERQNVLNLIQKK